MFWSWGVEVWRLIFHEFNQHDLHDQTSSPDKRSIYNIAFSVNYPLSICALDATGSFEVVRISTQCEHEVTQGVLYDSIEC